MRDHVGALVAVVLLGCGSTQPAPDAAQQTAAQTPDSERYGPLQVGGDFSSYTKLSTDWFLSPTHGRRFVEVYVNDVGLEAYKTDGAEIPVGTIVVKTSVENEGGKPTDVQGPTFVMEKRAPGYNAKTRDWYYAIHWEQIAPKWKKAMNGRDQVYWQTPSEKIAYCDGCHNNYDRELGGVPEAQRAW